MNEEPEVYAGDFEPDYDENESIIFIVARLEGEVYIWK